MNDWGIRTRVLVLALAPLTIIVALLSTHFTLTRLQDIDLELHERGQAIANQLAPACEYGVFSGNRDLLAGLARAALIERDVLAVTVADADGQTLARAARKRGAADTYVLDAPIVGNTMNIDDYGEQTVNGSGQPASGSRPPAIGTVRVELSRAATIARQHTVLAQSLGITLLGLLLTTMLALRMSRAVIGPVRDLTRTVERIKEGDLDERVQAAAGGELGILARGLNAMAAALGAARAREQQRAADAVYLEKVRAQVTLESIGDGVISTDAAGHIVYMNPVAEAFTGWKNHEAEGRPLAEVFVTIDERAENAREYPLQRCLNDGHVIRHDDRHLLVRRDGHKVAIQDSAAPVRDRDGNIIGAALVFHDVTEIQHMARRMAHLASHDPLTGLINRREFESRLHQALDSARAGEQRHALCYMDLDQFKIVNDTCGHIAGDELLKQLAQHLQRAIRQSDVLARLGGDEFGVILEGCSIEKAQEVAGMLRDQVRRFRFAWQGRAFEVGVSIGVVPITQDTGSLTQLMSAADSACYVAKDRGRNCIHVYQPDDAALAQRQGEMQWVHRIKQAIEDDSLQLYCQSIVPLRSGAPDPQRCYEILLRLHEPDRGVVLPSAFIPAAERYHLMPAIDRWVVGAAFRALAARNAQALGAATMFSINLSGQSLCDDQFSDFVLAEFARSRLDPRLVCFEITETAAIANLVRAQQFISTLKTMGCSFALDDFGSGLSSFGYLKSLPVDYLKIAGSFIQDLLDDAVDHAMVDSINQIGHIMGLRTIAESVENERIMRMLAEAGIDYAQGFGIDRPQPLAGILHQFRDDGAQPSNVIPLPKS